MGRPRKTEPDDALDAALALFWRCGYEGTTVGALVESTGMSRSSLYGAFGDKDALYARCLDRYTATRAGWWLLRLTEPDADLATIDACLGALAAWAGSEDGALGCFFVSAAIDRAPLDPVIAGVVRDGFDQVRACFRSALVRAADRGQLRPGAEADLDALAAFLGVVAQGLFVQARARTPAPIIDASVRVALASLPRTEP